MAKPEHTAYQVQVDFGDRDRRGTLALANSCIKAGKLRAIVSYRKKSDDRIQITAAEHGHISFGYRKAYALLAQIREVAKKEFNKGERPSFFLRKLTMSEFMAHENFKNYKESQSIGSPYYKESQLIGSLYKKYLLMDLLSKKGYQMS